MLSNVLCCLRKRLKGTAREQSAMLGSNTDGKVERDEVRGNREGLVSPPFFNIKHFRAQNEKNPTPSTSLTSNITMAKKESKKLNYFAGRIGFRGAPVVAVATYKSHGAILEKYPLWNWEPSDKEFFDSITASVQQLDGK